MQKQVKSIRTFSYALKETFDECNLFHFIIRAVQLPRWQMRVEEMHAIQNILSVYNN